MLQFFTIALNWIKDPKNKGIIKLVGIAILIAVILFQCNQNKGLRNDLDSQKSETERIINNNEALNDTIRQKKLNDSTLLAERLAIKISMKELKDGYSDLLLGFEQFRKQNPKVIEKITVNNFETIREVPVYAKMDSLGNGQFIFSDSAKYADGNSRKLSGNINYINKLFYKKDSTEVDINKLGLYSKVSNGALANFELTQKIKLKVGLFEDPKTKKVTIAATTSYPGITFSQLEGADIMDEVSKKAARNFRKTWGIGFNIGYGGTVDLKTSKVAFGPQVGIGIHYTPKLLQWGKK